MIVSALFRLREILERYKSIQQRIPKDLVVLMKPNKEVVDAAIRPGLTSITWSSVNIDECKISALSGFI